MSMYHEMEYETFAMRSCERGMQVNAGLSPEEEHQLVYGQSSGSQRSQSVLRVTRERGGGIMRQ